MRASNLLLLRQRLAHPERSVLSGAPPHPRRSCSAAGGGGGWGKRFPTVISSSSGSQRRPHRHLLRPNTVPSPALPGSRPNPTGMQPVTCAAAAVDVPLPPRPKETQRHLALTQLQKSQEKLRLRGRTSAPESRRGRARALTSRRERSKRSGKSLATSFGTALGGSTEDAATTITVVTSPFLPLQQPPLTTLAPPAAAA